MNRFSVALASLLMAGAVYAEDWPAPLQFLVDQGVEIHAEIDSKISLKSYAASFRGEPMELYLTPDGEYVIIGTLLDAQGKEVARPEVDRLTLSQQSSLDWQTLSNSYFVAEGAADAEHVVYMFNDPNCLYCANLWQLAQPYVNNGGLQLRHIMVGMLHPSSELKAATILAAEDPAKLLAHHESTLLQGGIAPASDLPEAIIEQVRSNTLLMEQHGLIATPSVIFRDSDNQVRQIQGIPDEALISEQVFGRSTPAGDD